MELKHIIGYHFEHSRSLLIVPYGIETWKQRHHRME